MAKIMVAVKRCIDYTVQIRVKPNLKGVVTEGVKFSINPFDEVGVEEAVLMKEKKFAKEIIAVSCGPQDSQAVIRKALAMGATAGYHVNIPNEQYELLQPYHVSKILAKLSLNEQVDLIILGKQAIDDDCYQTAQMTASLLNWPQCISCSKIEVLNHALLAKTQTDDGLKTLKVNLPAVLSVDLSLNTPRYTTLPNIIKTRSIKLKVFEAKSFEVDLSPKIDIVEVRPSGVKRKAQMVPTVDALLSKLRQLNLIK